MRPADPQALLTAGTACADITPPFHIPYLGYVPRQAFFRGVHDRLHARALVLDDGRTSLALITADAIGFSSRMLGRSRHFGDELRAGIAERTGIPPESVMLAASHAHSTPETLDITQLSDVPGAIDWLEQLIRTLAGTVVTAQQGLQPAVVKFGTGCARGIAANRRQLLADGRMHQPSSGTAQAQILRAGVLDEEVGVLLVELADGTYSCLVHFACHPVSVQVQPLVSADYPGVACALVQRAAPGCRHCLFVQGADGDVNPLGGGQRRSFDDVSRYGQILGGEVLKVLARLRGPEADPMAPALATAQRRVSLPIRPLPDPAPYRHALEQAHAQAALATSPAEEFVLRNQARTAAESLRTIELGADPMDTEVQVLRVGDVALVGCPGELFAALGQEIKQQGAAPHALVVGYANDYAGYLSTPAAFAEGGYETSLGPWCRVAPQGGRLLVDAALELTHQLWVERPES